MASLADVANPLLFFFMVVTLFPLGLGPDPQQLASMAPGILWVVALLASLMVSARMFASDFEDGSLEQMALAPHPLSVLALGEVAAHWLATGCLLALVSPLFAMMLGLPSQGLGVLVLSLLLGTLCLTLIGAVGSALTVSIRRGGLATLTLNYSAQCAGAHLWHRRGHRGCDGKGSIDLADAHGRFSGGHAGASATGCGRCIAYFT